MLQTTPPSQIDDYTWCWEFDEAFDQDHPDFEDLFLQAMETGKWDAVPRREGAEKPTVFTLTQLDARQKFYIRDVMNKQGQHQALWDAAALALKSVSNLVMPGGKPLEIKRRTGGKGWEVADEKSMAILAGPADGALVIALGLRAITNLAPSGK